MVFAWGKSVLVTGATGGVGSAICELFLVNGVKHLAMLDLSAKEPTILGHWRQEYPKASIYYFSVDVSCQEDLEKCYGAFVKGIESLDIVVNCAGILDESRPRKVVEVNLCGTIASTLLAVEYMRADRGGGKGGVVVNIASIAGITPMSYSPTYSATKHAMVAFTRSLAHGRDGMGIKFLTLCPGGTLTSLMLTPKFFEIKTMTLIKMLRMFRLQSADRVADAIARIIEEGKNGSVWIVENGELTEHIATPIKI